MGIYGERVCQAKGEQGSESCGYAGRTLKAGDAAQPRGCSARFVPSAARIAVEINQSYVCESEILQIGGFGGM